MAVFEPRCTTRALLGLVFVCCCVPNFGDNFPTFGDNFRNYAVCLLSVENWKNEKWFLGARGAPASSQLTEFQPRFSIFSVQARSACTEKLKSATEIRFAAFMEVNSTFWRLIRLLRLGVCEKNCQTTPEIAFALLQCPRELP